VQGDILASDGSTTIESTGEDSVLAESLVCTQAAVKDTTLAMLAIHRSKPAAKLMAGHLTAPLTLFADLMRAGDEVKRIFAIQVCQLPF
jgi:hypothetical protein